MATNSEESGSRGANTQSPEQLSGTGGAGAAGAQGGTPQRVHSVRQQPQRRPSSPNASSVPITQAAGESTYGRLNQHPKDGDGGHQGAGMAPLYKVGVSEDRNKKCRRTMEDSHAFIYDFGGVKGQGYFAVFDGHAGKHAAEWCGANFHNYLLEQLRSGQETQPIPDLLNETFHVVDRELSKLAAQGGTNSGCTAVTAFLRLEDENGNAVELDQDTSSSVGSHVAQGGVANPEVAEDTGAAETEQDEEKKHRFGDGQTRERIKSLFSSSSSGSKGQSSSAAPAQPDASTIEQTRETGSGDDNAPARPKNLAKRTLYTANVGDARAVLSRGGKAVRLTYDHKGSDAQEAKRIMDAGGFVMNNRVNGILAVTRSLGDSKMKEFVVGSPYTTETTLGDDDEWLIIACDGLWDVCEDQTAVDIISQSKDAQHASKALLDHALTNFSTDNLSVMVVALKP